MGVMLPQARNANQDSPGVWREEEEEEFSLESLNEGGPHQPPDFRFLPSDCERIHFYCCKAPTWWSFVTAVTGNIHYSCLDSKHLAMSLSLLCSTHPSPGPAHTEHLTDTSGRFVRSL